MSKYLTSIESRSTRSPRFCKQAGLYGIRTGSKVEFSAAAGHLEVRVQSALASNQSGAGMLKSRKKAVPADFDPAALLR